MKEFVTGDHVMAHCADGSIRENVVWSEAEGVVYLCSEHQFEELKAGRMAPPPVGFQVQDVEPICAEHHG